MTVLEFNPSTRLSLSVLCLANALSSIFPATAGNLNSTKRKEQLWLQSNRIS